MAMWDNILRSFSARIIKCMKDTDLVNQMHGLELIQISINIINIRTFAPVLTNRIPDALFEIILISISNALQSWRRNQQTTTLMQVQLLHSLNIPHCYEMILASTLVITEHLNAQVNLLSNTQLRLAILQILFQIRIEILAAKQDILRFSRAPFNTSSETFHFKTVFMNDETIRWFMPFTQVLKHFKHHAFPMPVLLKAVNSPMLEKIIPVSCYEIIGSSTDPICQICHNDLKGGSAISVPLHCNHVCCKSCAEAWFSTLNKANHNW